MERVQNNLKLCTRVIRLNTKYQCQKNIKGLGFTSVGSTMHSGSVKRKNFHSMINDTVIVVKVLNDAPA